MVLGTGELPAGLEAGLVGLRKGSRVKITAGRSISFRFKDQLFLLAPN